MAMLEALAEAREFWWYACQTCAVQSQKPSTFVHERALMSIILWCSQLMRNTDGLMQLNVAMLLHYVLAIWALNWPLKFGIQKQGVSCSTCCPSGPQVQDLHLHWPSILLITYSATAITIADMETTQTLCLSNPEVMASNRRQNERQPRSALL